MSTDSHFSHLAWATQPRKQGGLGPDLKLPLIADKSMSIARDYNVLIEEEGVALRGLFIIDPKGTLRSVFFLSSSILYAGSSVSGPVRTRVWGSDTAFPETLFDARRCSRWHWGRSPRVVDGIYMVLTSI